MLGYKVDYSYVNEMRRLSAMKSCETEQKDFYYITQNIFIQFLITYGF